MKSNYVFALLGLVPSAILSAGINSGGSDFTAADTTFFSADSSFLSGNSNSSINTGTNITGSTDQTLFGRARLQLKGFLSMPRSSTLQKLPSLLKGMAWLMIPQRSKQRWIFSYHKVMRSSQP